MSYYTRVLTTGDDCVAIGQLTKALEKSGCRAVIHSDTDTAPDDWEQITRREAVPASGDSCPS